jgi:hypothetical protein
MSAGWAIPQPKKPPQRVVFWNSKEVLDAPLPRFVQRIVEQ